MMLRDRQQFLDDHGLDADDVRDHLPIGDPPQPDDYERDEPDQYDGEPDEEEPDDDELADLDQILAEATAATEEDKRLRQARKRLSHISKHGHESREAEQTALLAEIRALEAKRVWITVGVVALFHTQECSTCGSHHAFFQGWMTEQAHATDKNARRLVAGRPIEPLPERREDHAQGQVDCCSDCVECVIAINRAAQGEVE